MATSHPGPDRRIRDVARYARATRSNAIVKQYIIYQRACPHLNPIPFDLIVQTLDPITQMEISKALRHRPLPPHLDREDLNQECLITLMKCLNKFIWSRNFFLPYYRKAIRRALKDIFNYTQRACQDSFNSVDLPEGIEVLDSEVLTHPNLLSYSQPPPSQTLATLLKDPLQAKVTLMISFQQMPLPRVAKTLGLSVNKVRKTYRQALSNLRLVD